jgi:hypothetical protein
MSKHTPGPWIYKHDASAGYGRFETTMSNPPMNDPVVLAVREDWIGFLDRDPQGQANALLISAAPELYQALRLVLAIHENSDGPSGPGGPVPGYGVRLDPMAERQIRAAIAKATGEQK